ncbi:MAG: hypothetical protein LBS31_08395 [Candidatus Adiutrix sp.]|nr:hypothetical protein [Candidatus Adiutrix sp.]
MAPPDERMFRQENNEMATAVFMDLDDTVFQTMRKCRKDGGPLKAAAMAADGSPSSYFEPGQYHLLERVLSAAMLIPVTARDLEALGRVRLTFKHGAIADYGGVILDRDGRPDQSWHDRMATLCADARPILMEARDRADGLISAGRLACRARLISDLGLCFYLVIKNYNSRLEELDEIKAALTDFAGNNSLQINLNDNNLSFLPGFLNKARAVAYFMETRLKPRHGRVLTIGMGDSLGDFKFLKLCDFMLIPSRSQLADDFSPQNSCGRQ